MTSGILPRKGDPISADQAERYRLLLVCKNTGAG